MLLLGILGYFSLFWWSDEGMSDIVHRYTKADVAVLYVTWTTVYPAFLED